MRVVPRPAPPVDAVYKHQRSECSADGPKSIIRAVGGLPVGYGKRSFAGGMMMSAMWPSPRVKAAPRTMATGRPAVLPRASSAAEANSSATARTVDFITRPSASGTPRRSSRGNNPDTPIATSTMPQRHGRPNESDTTTGTSWPKRARTADGAPPPGAPERVGHDDGHARAKTGTARRPDPHRRRIRIARKERDERARIRPDIRRVAPAVRADEAVRRLGDEDAVLHPHDA